MNKLKRLLSASLATLAATVVYGVKLSSSDVSFAQAQNSLDPGNLVLRYEVPKDRRYGKIYRILQQTAFYDELVADLNGAFRFPRNIGIIFDECHEENAFYDAETVEVIMCYELIKYYADITHRQYQEDYALEVIYASLFTFYHELGHALIDQYQLPITGQEEDAVDEFAAILLIDSQDYDAVVEGMNQFEIDALEEAELPYWSEHSLNEQRFYNVACFIYGSDPGEYGDWIDDDVLPEERAELCEADYQRARTSWQRLLAPHRK